MRLPSLKFLKTFQVAAKLQSFKAAAEELFVTPSAVSHQIKALEGQLGVALFERGMRTLTLTDAGAHYLEHISDIFAKLESVTEQLQVRFGRSIIRLNVPPFFANELLLPRLASFSQAREETDIRIETAFSAPKTHPPEADLSIVLGSGPWDGLTVYELFAQSFIAACSPAFLLENPINSYADLHGKTLLLHEERREAWERWAAGLGIEPIKPNRLVRLDTMTAVVLAAEQGVGIALVPSRLSADRFAAGGLVRLFDAELATNESYVLLHRPEDRAREDLQTDAMDLEQVPGCLKAAAAAGPAAVELVVAVAENDVIGRGNQLPWRLPADLRHFKALTVGKPVLMGRKTYESIGKALAGRLNIVLSRSPGFSPGDCVVVKTLQDARVAAGRATLMVIGGADIYRQCLTVASRIHLTLVHAQIEDGDTVFPGWRGPEWHESSRERHEADDKNAYAYSFITLDRTG